MDNAFRPDKIQKKENRLEEKSIKEGVSFVYEQNPALKEIGTTEQYSEYVDSIFPDSTVKNILYHGTRNEFDEFSKEFLGKNTGSPSAFNGFFFASSVETSLSYIGKQKTEYSKEYLDYLHQYSDIMKENDHKIKEIEKETGVIYKRTRSILKKIADFVTNENTKKKYEDKISELDKIREEQKELWEKHYMLDKTLGGYADSVGRPVEEFYDTYIEADEGTRVLAVVLDMKNPGLHDDKNQGYRAETYNNRTLADKVEGRDGTIISNTKDFSIFVSRPALFGRKEIKENTDVYVVYEPKQVHILGSQKDQEEFKEFVEKQRADPDSHGPQD